MNYLIVHDLFFAETAQAVHRQYFFKDLDHKRNRIMTGNWVYKVCAFEICGNQTRLHISYSHFLNLNCFRVTVMEVNLSYLPFTL